MFRPSATSICAGVALSFSTVPLPANAGENSIFVSKDQVLRRSFDLPQGNFVVETMWTTAAQTAGEVDVLSGRVSFRAKLGNPSGICTNISFIQTARILDNKGNDYQWPAGQSVRNQIRTKRTANNVEQGYFVDHDATQCAERSSECSPFFRDHWPNSDLGSQDGSLEAEKQKAAVLVDFPYGWELITSAELETCAVCRDTKKTFGCVTWGGTWPLTGERFLHGPKATNSPSTTFEKALSLFQSFYSE
jgi:hypothetical protein